MNSRGHIRLLRLGSLALVAIAAAVAGALANADDLRVAGETAPFHEKYEGRLATMIVEDRVLELFKVRSYPIYFIEFQTSAIQSQALDRVGIFVESDEYHGKILAPSMMKKISPDALFDGHDYAVEDVARFYSYAARLAIRLNPMEKHLKDLLIRIGLLFEDGDTYIATHRAALLSTIAGLDERYGAGTRRLVLDHEFRHGYYFVTLEPGVHAIWEGMLSKREREMIGETLRMTARYNSDDPALMEREFHSMVFEKRFEEHLWHLAAPQDGKPPKATIAEVTTLLGKLPDIRDAFRELESRL